MTLTERSPSPWLALPDLPRARTVVTDSWLRAERSRLDPDRVLAPLELDADALADARARHPLAAAVPLVRRLLVDATDDTGVIVAIGDAAGRLLWVEGDRSLRAGAEQMRFVAGARWSEGAVGTSAPGTALQLDHAVQIHGREHYASLVKQWSCSAVPLHDPETRRVLGVLDITGGADVVGARALALLEATAAAVESELLVERLRRAAAPARVRRRERREQVPCRSRLDVLGRDTGLLHADGQEHVLSMRHAEILVLLAARPDGYGAEELAEAVYGRPDAVGTLRAELVRLRGRLEHHAPELVPLTRPYRLPATLDVDALEVLALLDRGAHRAALASHRGHVLPDSESPGVTDLRRSVVSRLRDAALDGGSADTVLDWAQTADGRDDVEAWRLALTLLPPRSPRRAGVVEHLEALERELG